MLSRTPGDNIIDLNTNQGGYFMKGSIATYQKCPKCGAKFPSSKGDFPIVCKNGCKTQPTKFHIKYYFDGDGQAAHRTLYGETVHYWGDATALLREIQTGMKHHKQNKTIFDPSAYHKQSKTAFKPFWNQFCDRYEGSTGSKIRTIGRYHLLYFNDFQMRDIKPFHIDQWWIDLKKKGLSPAYMNDIMTWLKSFFKWGKKYKVILDDMYFPPNIDTPEPEVDEWLTESEQVAVFQYIPDQDKPIFEFLFSTGARVNEACGLYRSDIDWKREVIIIQRTVKRDKSVGPTKNKKKRRISITQQLKKCLIRSTVMSMEYQFINEWGRRYHAEYLRNTFNKACRSADVKPIKLKNATRHSAGMRLTAQGYSISVVKDFYGHSSERMTAHYAKILDEQKKDMFEWGGGEKIKVQK